MPVIRAKKEEIFYNENASYSVEGDFNGTFQLSTTYCTIVWQKMLYEQRQNESGGKYPWKTKY